MILKNLSFLYKMSLMNITSYFRPKEQVSNEPLNINSIKWFGHATTVININNNIIITDPVMTSFLGYMKRQTHIPEDIRNIKFNYIILSHGHTDHIHFPTLIRLNRDAVVIAPKGYFRLLRLIGYKKIYILNHNEVYSDNNIIIKALPANHDGRRFYIGKNHHSNAYLICSKDKKVFFAGDTAYTDNFKHIESDVALMPVGCYKPDRFCSMHCTPEESYSMFKNMNCSSMIPIHYKTFILSLEDFHETHYRLKKINDNSIKIINIGECIKF